VHSCGCAVAAGLRANNAGGFEATTSIGRHLLVRFAPWEAVGRAEIASLFVDGIEQDFAVAKDHRYGERAAAAMVRAATSPEEQHGLLLNKGRYSAAADLTGGARHDGVLAVSEREAARRLALSPAQLRRLRAGGEGPRAVQLSERRIAYRVVDLEAWLEGRPTAL